MQRLNDAQRRGFAEAARADFEARVAAHVHEHLPDEAARLGDAELAMVVRAGVDEARSLGLVTQRDVCKFIDLTVVFGVGFATRCDWARDGGAAIATARDKSAALADLFARSLEELQ